MPLPLALIGGGLAAGGLAGSIFGRKKRGRFDTSGINRLIEQGGQEERQTIGRIRPETAGLTGQFGSDINAAQAEATEAGRGAAGEFLQNFDPVTSRLVQQRQDQLKRETFGAIPELVQAAREAGAAGGGLDRGVIQGQLANIPIQQGAQFAEGVSNLQQEALRGQLAAREKVFDATNQRILTNLGIDENTATQILNSGNTALINELNGLIDESRNRVGLGIQSETLRQGQNIAQAQGAVDDRQAIFQNLTNLGGSFLGAGLPSGIQQPGSNATQLSGRAANEEIMRRRLLASGALRS